MFKSSFNFGRNYVDRELVEYIWFYYLIFNVIVIFVWYYERECMFCLM